MILPCVIQDELRPRWSLMRTAWCAATVASAARRHHHHKSLRDPRLDAELVNLLGPSLATTLLECCNLSTLPDLICSRLDRIVVGCGPKLSKSDTGALLRLLFTNASDFCKFQLSHGSQTESAGAASRCTDDRLEGHGLGRSVQSVDDLTRLIWGVVMVKANTRKSARADFAMQVLECLGHVITVFEAHKSHEPLVLAVAKLLLLVSIPEANNASSDAATMVAPILRWMLVEHVPHRCRCALVTLRALVALQNFSAHAQGRRALTAAGICSALHLDQVPASCWTTSSGSSRVSGSCRVHDEGNDWAYASGESSRQSCYRALVGVWANMVINDHWHCGGQPWTEPELQQLSRARIQSALHRYRFRDELVVSNAIRCLHNLVDTAGSAVEKDLAPDSESSGVQGTTQAEASSLGRLLVGCLGYLVDAATIPLTGLPPTSVLSALHILTALLTSGGPQRAEACLRVGTLPSDWIQRVAESIRLTPLPAGDNSVTDSGMQLLMEVVVVFQLEYATTSGPGLPLPRPSPALAVVVAASSLGDSDSHERPPSHDLISTAGPGSLKLWSDCHALGHVAATACYVLRKCTLSLHLPCVQSSLRCLLMLARLWTTIGCTEAQAAEVAATLRDVQELSPLVAHEDLEVVLELVDQVFSAFKLVCPLFAECMC